MHRAEQGDMLHRAEQGEAWRRKAACVSKMMRQYISPGEADNIQLATADANTYQED